VLRRCRLLCVCSCDPRLLPLSFVFWIFKFPMRPLSRFLRRLCDIPAVFNHKLSVVTLTDTLKPVRSLPSLSRFFEATRGVKSNPVAYCSAQLRSSICGVERAQPHPMFMHVSSYFCEVFSCSANPGFLVFPSRPSVMVSCAVFPPVVRARLIRLTIPR